MIEVQDPDISEMENVRWWAASYISAIRCGDKAREDLAMCHIHRLGYLFGLFRDEEGIPKAEGKCVFASCDHELECGALGVCFYSHKSIQGKSK